MNNLKMNLLFYKVYKRLKKGSAIYMLLPMIFLSVGLDAQNLNIKGKVIDSKGEVLPGTAVRIQ
jgi:hypothetical protein